MLMVGRAVFAAFLLLAWGHFVLAEAPSPREGLQLRPGAPTQSDYRKANLEFCLREVDLYEKHTDDPPRARAAAADFLRRAVSRFSEQLESEDPLAAEWARLPALGAVLADKAGSGDPLVLAHYADALLDDGQTEKALSVAEKSLARFDESNYPPGMRLAVLLRVQRVATRIGDPNRIAQIQAEIYQAAPAWLAYATQPPGSERLAWNYYARAAEKFSPEAAQAAVEAYGQQSTKDAWLWEMLQGKYHYDLAWHVRGSGRAHVVKLDDWREYLEQMKLAARHFRAAYELNSELPEAATAMITVSKEGHDLDSIWDWFYRAVAAEADHMPAYEAVLQSLRPRWGGSLRELFEFGEACVRTNRYDTDIPYVYVLAGHAAHTDTQSWQTVLEEPRLYDKMAYVLTRLVDHPSRAGKKNMSRVQADLLSQQLGFAVLAEQFQDAQRLWNRLGERMSDRWLAVFGLQEKYDRSRIAAYADHGPRLLALRPLTTPPRNEPANARRLLAGYQQLLAENRNPQAAYYLRNWVELAQMEVDYHDGKWVDLKFDAEMSHWMGDRSLWTFEDEHTATGSNVNTGDPLSLYHLGQFPGPKEITGEIELVRTLSPGLMFGFYVGMAHPAGTAPAEGRFFGVDPKTGHAGIGIPLQPIRGERLELDNPRVLHVKAWGPERFELLIDGRRFGGISSDPDFSLESNRVGIGTLWWARMAGEIRYANLRIRKLTDQPSPDQTERVQPSPR